MFKIGQLVKLKSGSPVMTIIRDIDSMNRHEYDTIWISNKNIISSIRVREECLIPVKKAKEL
jgi:uncharacterized protein YodC (DUF2158 family)